MTCPSLFSRGGCFAYSSVFSNDISFLEFPGCNTKLMSMLCNYKFFRLIKDNGETVARGLFLYSRTTDTVCFSAVRDTLLLSCFDLFQWVPVRHALFCAANWKINTQSWDWLVCCFAWSCKQLSINSQHATEWLIYLVVLAVFAKADTYIIRACYLPVTLGITFYKIKLNLSQFNIT